MDAPRIAGRYEVIRPLGQGSFAQTLLARDLKLGREVAVKVLHRLNSGGGFFYPECYLRIDNTHLSPAEAARRIVEAFGLPAAGHTGTAPGGSIPS